MPAVPQGYGQQQHGGGQSCMQKVKMGAMMGLAIGCASGVLFGGYACVVGRLRGREALAQMGKMIVASGGSFGTFMAVGQGIRC